MLISRGFLWHHCLGVFWICIQPKEQIGHGSKAGAEEGEKAGNSASYATHKGQSSLQPPHIDALPPITPLFGFKAI